MTTTDLPATSSAEGQRRDALAERLFGGLLESMELLSVHLGLGLGLYTSLDRDGPADPPELADRAGIHPRYAREWLEQQAAAGFLEVAGDGVDPDQRRFSLPPGHAEALLDPDSPAAVSSVAPAIVGIVGVLDALATSYRTGGGVPYADFGTGIRHSIGGMNRPMFNNDLPSWLAAVPGLDARLRGQDGRRILDVGCGTGWSTIALARLYPDAQVQGIDLDAASLEEAARHAVATGVEDRVTFDRRDATAVTDLDGSFDLVCIFEALHDMAHPVRALAAVRGVLDDGGSLVVADERVAEVFTAPADFNDRLMYAFSVLHCLPATMAEGPAEATGTVMRSSTLRRYAIEAGFHSVEELPVENDLWRLYSLST